MTSPSRPGLSRRALFGWSGSALLLATAAAAWRRWPSRAEAAAPRTHKPIPYVDHDGWMVSLAEKRALQVLPPAGGER